MTQNTPTPDEQADWLTDLFDDIRGTCESCEHPRCLARIESAKAVIEAKMAERETAIVA